MPISAHNHGGSHAAETSEARTAEENHIFIGMGLTL